MKSVKEGLLRYCYSTSQGSWHSQENENQQDRTLKQLQEQSCVDKWTNEAWQSWSSLSKQEISFWSVARILTKEIRDIVENRKYFDIWLKKLALFLNPNFSLPSIINTYLIQLTQRRRCTAFELDVVCRSLDDVRASSMPAWCRSCSVTPAPCLAPHARSPLCRATLLGFEESCVVKLWATT